MNLKPLDFQPYHNKEISDEEKNNNYFRAISSIKFIRKKIGVSPNYAKTELNQKISSYNLEIIFRENFINFLITQKRFDEILKQKMSISKLNCKLECLNLLGLMNAFDAEIPASC